MSRPGRVRAALAGQWPVLGVDPESIRRLRRRAENLRLSPAAVAAVDWLVSLLLFIAPFLAHLLLGGGTISATGLFVLLALGTLLFIALQRPLRTAALILAGADPEPPGPC